MTDAVNHAVAVLEPHAAPPPSARERGAHVAIVPATRWPSLDLQELWRARDLFLFLVGRDVKVRYAQTVLGAAWAVLQPLVAMAIFSLVFGRFARIPSDGVPYGAFALTALVPWTYFATALTGASNSLVVNTNLLTKVYFPRLAMPLAPIVAGLIDFAIAFVMLLLVLAWYGIMPSPLAVAVLPLLLLITALTAAGMGAWLAALNIQYRDVKHVTPFLVQIWMYASPIVYPMSIVPRELHTVYALNPMAGVISGFRAVMLGRGELPWSMIAMALLSSMLLFVAGTLYFRRTERIFADVA